MRARTVLVGCLLAGSTACLGCGSGSGILPAPASAPTWFRDVEPIVQVNCNGCHAPGGIGVAVFDQGSAATFAPVMAQKVMRGEMPPWPPGPLGKPIVGARLLTQVDVDTIAKWAAAGAPLGSAADHQDRSPRVTFNPGRAPDAQAMMPAPGYLPPPPASPLSDEVRCFVIDLGNTSNVWVRALNWVAGQPGAIHHIGGLAVDAASAAAARAFYNLDGRPGYECAGSFGKNVNGVAGFSASGAGRDTGSTMPAGAGIFIPAGSSVILSVHYVMANVKGADKSGVQLWYATDAEKTQLRPMVQYQFGGPSELPCPTGVTVDPADRCSREYGIAQVKSETVEKTRAMNDFLLKKCGTTLTAYYANLKLNAADTSHFYIPSGCDDAFPFDGVIQLVHAHMHTRGASAAIRIQKVDGSWDALLDIPKYLWTWEGSYLLAEGVTAHVGQKLRLDCQYDNGDLNQWNAMTHQPGHDGPALPPLEPPHYVVAGPERGDDMCAAFLTVEPSAYKQQSWVDSCHEAQAIYDDLCTDHGVNFVATACTDTLERFAVFLIETPPARRKATWCAPKGAGAAVGATCDLASNCALGCAAVNGFANGITAMCAQACKTNVNSWGRTMGQPAQAASPSASWKLDALLACGAQACGDQKVWQSYLGCIEVACTEDFQACYGK